MHIVSTTYHKVVGVIFLLGFLFLLASAFPVLWEVPFSKNSTEALHQAPYAVWANIKSNAKGLTQRGQDSLMAKQIAKQGKRP